MSELLLEADNFRVQKKQLQSEKIYTFFCSCGNFAFKFVVQTTRRQLVPIASIILSNESAFNESAFNQAATVTTILIASTTLPPLRSQCFFRRSSPLPTLPDIPVEFRISIIFFQLQLYCPAVVCLPAPTLILRGFRDGFKNDYSDQFFSVCKPTGYSCISIDEIAKLRVSR